MELKGKLIKKLQVESGTGNNGYEWKNQTLVFEHVYDNGIPEFAKQFVVKVGNNKNARVNIDTVQDLEVGVIYNMKVNVSSREYNNKYFTTLNVWSISEETNNYNINNDINQEAPF